MHVETGLTQTLSHISLYLKTSKDDKPSKALRWWEGKTPLTSIPIDPHANPSKRFAIRINNRLRNPQILILYGAERAPEELVSVD